MNTITDVLSRVDHGSSLEDRINQIAQGLVAEYRLGNRLLEHATYYVFNVWDIPSYGELVIKPDFDARISDMREYCMWCAAHGVTETIHLGEVWQTASTMRPSEASDHWDALMVAGVGQKQGGLFHTTLPIPDGDIKPVVMQPRGTLGTFDLLAPAIEVTPELRSQMLDLIEQFDVKVFGNFITTNDPDGNFVLEPFRDYFGMWHPIYPGSVARIQP